MKQPIRNTILPLALALLCLQAALADDKTQGLEMPQAADMAAMEKAMQEAMSPGDQHAFLSSLEGEWALTSTVWMDPSQPPMTSQGKSVKTMILGGRYLSEEASGEMMGQPFHGQGITGYDNIAGEYVSTWIDDMGTGIMVSRGERDGKTLTLKGEFVDPMSKQPMDVRLVTRIVDQDHHIFEMFMTMPGAPEFKSMQIEYVRGGAD